jgi:hypothetical protein
MHINRIGSSDYWVVQFTYTHSPHTWILERVVIILIINAAVTILINASARTRTQDLCPWYHIELHAPTSSTQRLKLMRKSGQFTYTPTRTTSTIYLKPTCSSALRQGKLAYRSCKALVYSIEVSIQILQGKLGRVLSSMVHWSNQLNHRFEVV